MGKISEYNLLKEEIKTEVEMEYLEKLAESLDKLNQMRSDVGEALYEIRMGVSQAEHEAYKHLPLPERQLFLMMIRDLNEWIEAGLERLAK